MKWRSWSRLLTLVLVVVILASTGTPVSAVAPVTLPFSSREMNNTLCTFPVEFGAEGIIRIFDSDRADFTVNLHLTIWYENLNTGERIYSINVNRQETSRQHDGTYLTVGQGVWALFHLPGQGHGLVDVGKIIITSPGTNGAPYDTLYHNGVFDPSNGNFMFGVCEVLG